MYESGVCFNSYFADINHQQAIRRPWLPLGSAPVKWYSSKTEIKIAIEWTRKETHSITVPQSSIHSFLVIRIIFTWSKSEPYDMFVEVISIIAIFQDVFQKESAWLI